MNLFLRMLALMFSSGKRSKVGLLDECETPFRVWFTDLDVLRHVNNGKYFSIQDLARIDMMNRAGVSAILKKNGWYPVVTGETLQFKKSLKLFEKFNVHTRIISWDKTSFILEHKFVKNKEIIAFGLLRARFLKMTGGSVTPEEILKACGFPTVSPVAPEFVQQWMASNQTHSEIVKAQFPGKSAKTSP